MKTIQEGIVLCTDCFFLAETGDATGLDFHYSPEEVDAKLKEIEAGLKRLGMGLTITDERDEFSNAPCDCCGTKLAGERHHYVILGEDHDG